MSALFTPPPTKYLRAMLMSVCCGLPPLPLLVVQDVVTLSGMKVTRQGTDGIRLEPSDTGIFPALKPKVARVLQKQAAVGVGGKSSEFVGQMKIGTVCAPLISAQRSHTHTRRNTPSHIHTLSLSGQQEVATVVAARPSRSR